MATSPTPIELRAYSRMQARMLALLMRFNEGEYRKLFKAQRHFGAAEDVLPIYRDLGVLFFLRDELFEHILPRIIRRLSFATPRRLVVEEPPGRGRIDWERTLDASWAERPGEPPLVLHSRQHLRDFATAENLLTVVTLLEYRADVRRVLLSPLVGTQVEALRHPLTSIVERCERELAFPQLAGLRHMAQRILEGGEDEVRALEQRVASEAIPGGNSAYDELLAWRQRYRELELLQRLETATPIETVGVNPRRDNRLYQLWIVLELADLLAREQRIVVEETALPEVLCFDWGEGAGRRRYELRHDQGVPEPPAVWSSEPVGSHVPGVRPDYYLRRIDPPAAEVVAGGALVWREPGVVWDAKYYRESERKDRAPGEPVKRMLADLALTGERHGTLLFAFLRPAETGPVETDDGATVASDAILVQRFSPLGAGNQALDPAIRIEVAALCPAQPDEETRRALRRLLDQAHGILREPVVPACHGIFLDALSAGERSAISDRWGRPITDPSDDLLICPKPHIGPWRVDIVSRARHCCQDGRLCHIIGMPGAQKPVRPPRDIESLLREIDHILATRPADELDEEVVSAVAERVQGLTRRFAELQQVDLEIYHERVRALGMRQTFDLLGPAEQESLALAIFLTDQLFKVRANDYSAPAIHLSSVIEIEVKRRIFTCPGLVGELANPRRQTLGVLPYLQRSDDLEGNWARISAYAAAHWNDRPIPDDPERVISFDDLISKALSRISYLRNKAAHTEPLPRRHYDELQDMVFLGGKLGLGVLNTLILAWKGLRTTRST